MPTNNTNTGHPSNIDGRPVLHSPSGGGGPANARGSTNTGSPGYKNENGNHNPAGIGNGKVAGSGNEKDAVDARHSVRGTEATGGREAAHVPVHHEVIRKESHVGDHRVLRDEHDHVREIHGRDGRGHELAIHRDVHGGTRFETRRADGRRVVGYGHGRGFTERAYYRTGNRVYVQRTYIYGGRHYVVAYRSYSYRGVVYYRYAPVYYYHPVFYGWVYNPWAAPVYYRWGWVGDPWYPYYGYYFAPYPYYANASLWLTDYLLAENLRLAYEARANADAAAAADYAAQGAAPAPQQTQVTLTPEVKQMIAEEVQRQLAAERAAADQTQGAQASAAQAATSAEEAPPALDPNQRIFIVASNVDLAGNQGECAVTAGDVLMRTGTTPNEQNKIAVNVVTSKKGDCPVNTNADVDVAELQEMHNQFREKLDSGLKTLADNQGKNGLPPAPNTQTVKGEAPPPQADNDAASELQDQEKSGEQTEQEVQKSSPGAAMISQPPIVRSVAAQGGSQ
jgi:hypothetical protein